VAYEIGTFIYYPRRKTSFHDRRFIQRRAAPVEGHTYICDMDADENYIWVHT
jgi:hypothetical protein